MKYHLSLSKFVGVFDLSPEDRDITRLTIYVFNFSHIHQPAMSAGTV